MSSHHNSTSTNVASMSKCGAGVGGPRSGSAALHTVKNYHYYIVIIHSNIAYNQGQSNMGLWLSPSSLRWVKYVNLIVPSPEDVFHLQTNK